MSINNYLFYNHFKLNGASLQNCSQICGFFTIKKERMNVQFSYDTQLFYCVLRKVWSFRLSLKNKVEKGVLWHLGHLEQHVAAGAPECKNYCWGPRKKEGSWAYSRYIGQGLLYLDGRNSQKYLHQDQADF